MNNDLLMRAIVTDAAKNVIATMDEEAKQEVFVRAIYDVLNTYALRVEVQRVLENEAKEFMKDYVKKPEIQEQIKEKVLAGVGEVMDGLTKAIACDAEGVLKNSYNRWVKMNE